MLFPIVEANGQQREGLRAGSPAWELNYQSKLQGMLSNTGDWKPGIAMQEPDAKVSLPLS